MNQDILKKIGLKVGHYTDEENLTGLTCFIAEAGAYLGIDIRGSNTATFDTAAYDPKSSIDLAHAVVLTGGSLFGLESAFGIAQYLEEKGIGTSYKNVIIPGVVGAVIYDLSVGKSTVRPNKENGYYAAQHATDSKIPEGSIGVGTGATIGKWFAGVPMKGGFGAGFTVIDEILVAAFAVTNAIGDVINPKTNQFYSESGQQNLVNKNLNLDKKFFDGLISVPQNTTLAVVATNMHLKKPQLMKVAEQAHNGMARAIHPIHTTLDGDVVFALSSLSGDQKEIDLEPNTLVDLVSIAAADALVKAINDSILNCKSIPKFPAYNK